MNKSIEKGTKELLCEIILLTFLMLITIPIYVNASNNYKESIKNIQNCVDMSVSLTNIEGDKYIVIENNSKEKVAINLVLKIKKFYNEYAIRIDGQDIYLSNLEYSSDDEFYYYDLGEYTIDKKQLIKYEMFLVGKEIYNDTISYSFIAEVLFC